MADEFAFDVFLSHSSKDKPTVRSLAERLRADRVKVWFDEWEIKPGDNIPSKIEDGLERSRVLLFCMSAHAFGSDWAALESQTFRFRDPLNKERRFLPLRLDEAKIRGSLAQFLYLTWGGEDQEREYRRLLEGCRLEVGKKKVTVAAGVGFVPVAEVQLVGKEGEELSIDFLEFSPDGSRLLGSLLRDEDDDRQALHVWNAATGRCERMLKGHTSTMLCASWSPNGRLALSGSRDQTVRLWDVESERCRHALERNTAGVWSVAWSPDGTLAISGDTDGKMRLWDIESGKCLRVFKGHTDIVLSVAWSADGKFVVSASADKTNRIWKVENAKCQHVLKGHNNLVFAASWSPNGKFVLSGGADSTVRLWDVKNGIHRRALEGHTDWVRSLAWSHDGRFALSGSTDSTVRLWEIESGRCLSILEGHMNYVVAVAWSEDGYRARSGDVDGRIRTWDLSAFVTQSRLPTETIPKTQPPPEQSEYTNAKVLIVGDTHAGKTGLTHRLATGEWKPSEKSTVGAWSTQWPLKDPTASPGVEREIWLWDFGGQADQRLIHQLYMDRTAAILLLFNADNEDVLPGLRDWQVALRRCVKEEIPYFLCAGRIDAGFKASKAKLQAFANEEQFAYHETSAFDGTGCDDLRKAIIDSIPWEQMTKRTSPRIFKLIKDEILKLRDEGQVLHTFKELREILARRITKEPQFSDDILKTVIGLLDGPGIVKELDYGTYVLLAPEWINTYAQAVLRTLRAAENELGALPIRSIEEGKLLFQSISRDGATVEMKRLPEPEERVVLREMERQLEERGLCLRQDNQLVFPSHCGRDRPAFPEQPAVFVSYAVQGYLDDIYATLVVTLAGCKAFALKELWRDAADFVTLRGDLHMGVKLTRDSTSAGEISIYFGKGVSEREQVIFAKYIDAHLQTRSEKSQRLRHYVCPMCHTSKGNPHALMEKLLAKKKNAKVVCDACDKSFDLWDDLEQLFAADEVRRAVEGLQAGDEIRLDSRRKGKLLALEVAARITSADQKCFDIPGTEDEGLDMELEFTDEGKGTGKRIYLQLKSGNSYLTKRKDGTEVFVIKKQTWVQYWLKQPLPVMLVIGTFAERDGRLGNKHKLEFADVRWMEISSVLRKLSDNGTKQVKQFEFTGERLDMTSIHRRRAEEMQRA